MDINQNPISIAIVGSGTAGLLSALIFRKAFPLSDITVVSSSAVGIIGVGEGSTEHWKQFMEICKIPLEEMIVETAATHKYGIRFENWTNHTPDYFHSITNIDDINAYGYIATYLKYAEDQKLATDQTATVGLRQDKIRRNHLHQSTNQFHFDTFKLNDYLTGVAFRRHIKFIDGEVKNVDIDGENGNIKSVSTKEGDNICADFWIDASGFKKVLMTSLNNTKWESFSKYLLCDSAIAFPTESDPNGKIRSYTRARAAKNGWVWEIPTQERRGNGYVYSSQFINEDEAIKELELMTGYKIETNRSFNFDAGYLEHQWVNNCVAVGLASSFVEPLEATSIGSTIQQIRSLIPFIASYEPGNKHVQKKYNSVIKKMMRNILTMIRLHYYSDRTDSDFWKAQASMPLNSELEELIDLWSEKPPSRNDVESDSVLLFHLPHLFHVAQGQGVIPPIPSGRALNNLGIRELVDIEVSHIKHGRHNHELVDHAEALRETKEEYQ